MEMTVALPEDYPLSLPEVLINRQLGASKEKWRQWMKNLVVFITHQNGSVLDAILMWKLSFEKHIQGVEACSICMMTIHGSNYRLPSVGCKRCRKKFHGECLRKWFSTSNKTECPLCRHTF
ncbi:unnamed protein product [Soboliphyme baturini]|uniref:E3 ubiquitin-protein ligase listerin n=1 Tax=Soboliphyme baturini TaxID=241478 RepID=A0A183J5K2_9BILA|nr:unnamed protein product [Soboliphyme baturini]